MGWDKYGIRIDSDKTKIAFYFYAEIDSIDGRTMESLKTYKALMRFWSSVVDRLTMRRKYSWIKANANNKDGNAIKYKKHLCENVKGNKVVKLYDNKGVLSGDLVCARRQVKTLRVFNPFGSIKRIYVYQNNKIRSVERYTRTGERMILGNIKGEL